MSETIMDLPLDNVIERACLFLEKWQWPGGFWIDFELVVGMSSQWVTAYISHCLAQANANSSALAPANKWLLQTQLEEGGWGYNRDIPPDGDSTANAVLFLAGYGRTNLSEEVLDHAAETLLTFRSNNDGGFMTYRPIPHIPGEEKHKFMFEGSGWCISHLSVTALAAVALHKVNPVKFRHVLKEAAVFIKQRQDPAGFWDDHWWLDRIYGTYWSSRFLNSMGDRISPQRAIDWLVRNNQDGKAWGNGLGSQPSPYHTALALSTLMLLDSPPRVHQLIKNGIAWLIENQRADGGWTSVPILLTVIPEIHEPWRSTDASSRQAVADQYSLFTSATVLVALVNYRDFRVRHVENSIR